MNVLRLKHNLEGEVDSAHRTKIIHEYIEAGHFKVAADARSYLVVIPTATGVSLLSAKVLDDALQYVAKHFPGDDFDVYEVSTKQ